MIETYIILFQKYDPEVSNFIKPREDSCTRGHKYKILNNRSRLDVSKYSFCMRVVASRNKLPSSVVEERLKADKTGIGSTSLNTTVTEIITKTHYKQIPPSLRYQPLNPTYTLIN